MNPKLRALFAGVGLLVVGGISFLVVQVKPGTSVAEFTDAGFDAIFDPEILECQIRLSQECRDLPDGGLRPRYATIRTKAWIETLDAGVDGGFFNLIGQPVNDRLPTLVFRWPRQTGHDCFETVGSPETACTVFEAGGCSIPALCNDDGSGTQPVAAAPDRCACRDPTAGQCRTPNPDGGVGLQTGLGGTISPPFTGAGCVRKPCNEMAGEQGATWPAVCPVQ